MRMKLTALALAAGLALPGCITVDQLTGDWDAAVAIFQRVQAGEKIVADRIRASIGTICTDRSNINAHAVQVGNYIANPATVRALNESLATYNAMCDSTATSAGLVRIAVAGFNAYRVAKAQLATIQTAVR